MLRLAFLRREYVIAVWSIEVSTTKHFHSLINRLSFTDRSLRSLIVILIDLVREPPSYNYKGVKYHENRHLFHGTLSLLFIFE